MMLRLWSFFFNDPAPTEIYTLSLHDALPISRGHAARPAGGELRVRVPVPRRLDGIGGRRALQARRGLLHPGTAAARVLLRERRGAHAGGAVFAAADGEDRGGALAPGAGAPALHLGADRSDHRRRRGEPRP